MSFLTKIQRRHQYGIRSLRSKRVKTKLTLLKKLNSAKAKGDDETVILLKEILRWQQ